MESDNHGTIRKTFKNHFEQKHESSDKMDKKNNRKSNNLRFWSKTEQTIVDERKNTKASTLPNDVKYNTHNLRDVEKTPKKDATKKDEINSIKTDNKNIGVEHNGTITNDEDESSGVPTKKRSVSNETETTDEENDVKE